MFLRTSYGDRLELIDQGRVPDQFKNQVNVLLKELAALGKSEKMATCCISYSPCEVRVDTTENDKFKERLDALKQNKKRQVIFFNSADKVTAILLDEGKELARDSMTQAPLTRIIFNEIQSLPNGIVAPETAKTLINKIDGILFSGVALNKIIYRVAVSGFGNKKESDRVSAQLKKRGVFFIPLNEVTAIDSKSNNGAIDNIDDTADLDAPDSERLTLLARFIADATTNLGKEKFNEILASYRIIPDGKKDHLENIRALIKKPEFKKLFVSFKENYEDANPVSFIIEVLYQYEKFDYLRYIQKSGLGSFDKYAFPTTLSEAERQRIILNIEKGDKAEAEQYKLKKITGKDQFPQYYNTLLQLANECHVNFDTFNIFYEALLSRSVIDAARNAAHCSEDSLITYLRNNPNELKNHHRVIIFSVKIPTQTQKESAAAQALSTEEDDDIAIFPRCDVCQIHVDQDLLAILNSANIQHRGAETLGSIPIIPTNPPTRDDSEETKIVATHNLNSFFKFVPTSPAISAALSDLSLIKGQDGLYGGIEHLETVSNRLVLIENFRKQHKNTLIKAAARGEIEGVRNILSDIKLQKSRIKLDDQNEDDGNTALHYAAMINIHEHPETMCEMISILLEAGADPTIENRGGKNVLAVFSEHCRDKQIELQIFNNLLRRLQMKCGQVTCKNASTPSLNFS